MIVRPFAPAAAQFCKVNNSFWDAVMPTCTPAEFMILNFIYRKTTGFNKTEEKLSYKQIRQGTGIKGKATVNTALGGLHDKGYITRRGVERGKVWYGLNQALEIEVVSGSKIELDDGGDKSHLVQKLNQPGSKIEPDDSKLVQKLNPLKDIYKDNSKRQLHEAVDFNSPDLSDELSQCVTIFRNNVGNLSPLQYQDMEAVYNDLAPPPIETKLEWFEYAILQAVNNRANNWNFPKAILENINRAGSLAQHKENRNGHKLGSDTGGQPDTNRPAGRGGETRRPNQREGRAPSKDFTSPGDTPHTGRSAADDAALRRIFGANR